MIVPSVSSLLRKPPAVLTPTRAPFKPASWMDIRLSGELDASAPGAAAAVAMELDNPGVGAGAAMAGAADASDAVASAAPISNDFLTISSLYRSQLCVFGCFDSDILLNPLSHPEGLVVGITPAGAWAATASSLYLRSIRCARSRANVSPRKKAGDVRFQMIISSTPNSRLSTPMTNTVPIPARDPLDPLSGLAIW